MPWSESVVDNFCEYSHPMISPQLIYFFSILAKYLYRCNTDNPRWPNKIMQYLIYNIHVWGVFRQTSRPLKKVWTNFTFHPSSTHRMLYNPKYALSNTYLLLQSQYSKVMFLEQESIIANLNPNIKLQSSDPAQQWPLSPCSFPPKYHHKPFSPVFAWESAPSYRFTAVTILSEVVSVVFWWIERWALK